MGIDRRVFVAGSAAVVAIAASGAPEMYGLIGKMTAQAGKRDALVEVLLEGVSDMPGCLSYVVARDLNEADTIWITEVWDRKESHAASLSLPGVKQAIAKARPMIAGMSAVATTAPVGGHGLVAAKS